MGRCEADAAVALAQVVALAVVAALARARLVVDGRDGHAALIDAHLHPQKNKTKKRNVINQHRVYENETRTKKTILGRYSSVFMGEKKGQREMRRGRDEAELQLTLTFHLKNQFLLFLLQIKAFDSEFISEWNVV